MVCILILNFFLAPVLLASGDIACVSYEYMVALRKNKSLGSEDACNFHRLKVRIRAEYSFGILFHGWKLLRGLMPSNSPLRKVIALARCLRKLCHCCTNESEIEYCEQKTVD